MKRTKIISFIAVAAAMLCSTQAWAGATYFKNLSLTVKNPETAKGRVYLTPHNSSDTSFCTISKKPEVAKVEGNLSNVGAGFYVDMFVFPADGYVLDCLTTPKAYASGNYRSEYVGSTKGYPLSSNKIAIDNDTLHNCTTTRPSAGASITPVSSMELYAIFVPAKKAEVRFSRAGTLESAVKACTYGEAVNDLKVTGPLGESDIAYLNSLSREKGLVRLDLTRASFTEVPDSAFYNSGLYELKLPNWVKRVGDYAFANSMGLMPVTIPDGATVSKTATSGCALMKMLGKKGDDDNNGLYMLLDSLLFGI